MEGKNITSPEGILMLFIAALFDLAAFLIFVILVWFFGIGAWVSTLWNWLGLTFFGLWVYLRGGTSLKEFLKTQVKMIEKVGKAEAEGGAKEGGSELPKTKNPQPKAPENSTNKTVDASPQEKESPVSESPQEENKPGLISKGVGAIKGFITRVGWSIIIKAFPIIGALWPGFTIFVWRELKRG